MQALADLGLSFREAEKYCGWHDCSVCGGRLVVAAGVMWGIPGQVVRCVNDPMHSGALKEERSHPMANDAALIQYQGSLSLSREGAEFVLTTIWPDAPKADVLKAALLCRDYGLNPLMKHVYLIKYEDRRGGGPATWAIVLGIGAKRLIARGRRNERLYSYADGPRMMNAEEQERIFGEVSKADWVAITVIECKGQKFPGYGRWPKATAVKGGDKGNTPQNMAMIRSESAALQKLNPGGFGDVAPDAVDESYEQSPTYPGVIETTSRVVDIATGEIKETPKQDKPSPAPAASPPVRQTPVPAPISNAQPPHGVVPLPGTNLDVTTEEEAKEPPLFSPEDEDPATVASQKAQEEMMAKQIGAVLALATRKGVSGEWLDERIAAGYKGRLLGELNWTELEAVKRQLAKLLDAK